MADAIEIVRLVTGAVFVLVAPGLVWSFLFFPRTRRLDASRQTEGIDWLERTALAFGLSIALVPITVFLLNYFLRVPLNALTAVIIVLAIAAAPVPFILKRNPDLARRLTGRKPPPEPTTKAEPGRSSTTTQTETEKKRTGEGAGPSDEPAST